MGDIVRDMKQFVLILCLVSVGCASTPIALSPNSVPPETIDDRWSLHVVTIDPDGGERVTRIWIAAENGEPAIRTNESRWWSNLERDPTIRIRLAGSDYPFRSESVIDLDGKARIDSAFLEKYGGWERMLFPQERGETHVHYARLLPVD